MKECEPDKSGKYHYTYKITNKINKKYYIGMHSTFNLNDSYMGSGLVIQLAIIRHGIENFEKEILGFFTTRKEASDDELARIGDLFEKDPLCYNLRGGGDFGGEWSEESRQKISKAHKGRTKENNYAVAKRAYKMKGRNKENDEGMRKISETIKGRTKHTHESIRKMSETLLGRTKKSHEGIRRQSEKISGRTKNSHRHILLMSIKKSKGIYITPERNYYAGGELIKHTGCRPFVCINNSKIFTAYALNRCKSWVLKCLHKEVGKTYEELGFSFIKFPSEVDKLEFCRQHGIEI